MLDCDSDSEVKSVRSGSNVEVYRERVMYAMEEALADRERN